MNKFEEIKEHMIMGGDVVWNDPDPILENDYRVVHIEDIHDDEEVTGTTPILIKYNRGVSEAEIFLHELMIIK